jgi:hypothetical protein
MPSSAFFLKWALCENKRVILVERRDTGLEVSIPHASEKTADRKGNYFLFDELWADSNPKVLVRTTVDGVMDTVNANNRLGSVTTSSKNGFLPEECGILGRNAV